MRTFRGGTHIPDNKTMSQYVAIEQMPIVADYFVALSQHVGAPAQPVVSVGDEVCQGQLLAKTAGFISANVHSPVCGEVVEIVKRKNARGAECDYIHIKSNGKQNEQLLPVLENPTPEQIVQRIAEAGIVGCGGAGFPTAVKVQPKNPVDTLIINAAECEPYLNCDNRLLIERAQCVVDGARLLAVACDAKHVFIGLESNKTEAYSALLALDGVVGEKDPKTESDVVVTLLKTKYPQGAEKALIKACTNREVPAGGLPAAVGCVVCNVATAYCVWDAVKNGRTFYKRIVTVSGRGIGNPHNLEVLIGTPLSAIVEFCGGLSDDVAKLVAGGPMMGFSLISTDVYTTKTDGGFLALTQKEASTVLPTPCISCGRCVDVCPMKLMPLYIDFYAAVGDVENAVKFGALNCYECGSCAYVCPAKRPLVQSVRLTKQRVKEK